MIAEQVSQILTILSSNLRKDTYPIPTFCQIVLVAKNGDDLDLFKRVWSTSKRPYDMFLSLYNRIVADLVGTLSLVLQQPEVSQPRDETEAMMLESGLADVSGDVSDVLEQVTSYEQIETVSVSVKLKCRGLVAYSKNENVVQAFKKWMNAQVRSYLNAPAGARRPRRVR